MRSGSARLHKQRILRAQRGMIVDLDSSWRAIRKNAQLRIAHRAAVFFIRDISFSMRAGGKLLRRFGGVLCADHYTRRECPHKEEWQHGGYQAAER